VFHRYYAYSTCPYINAYNICAHLCRCCGGGVVCGVRLFTLLLRACGAAETRTWNWFWLLSPPWDIPLDPVPPALFPGRVGARAPVFRLASGFGLRWFNPTQYRRVVPYKPLKAVVVVAVGIVQAQPTNNQGPSSKVKSHTRAKRKKPHLRTVLWGHVNDAWRGQQTLRHDQSINQSKVLKSHTQVERSRISSLPLPHGGSTRCVTMNQRSSRTTHGQSEFTYQHRLTGSWGQQTLRHDQSINQSKVLKNHTWAKRSHISALPHGGSKRCVTINQSIKGPHRATHGQGGAASQHHHRRAANPASRVTQWRKLLGGYYASPLRSCIRGVGSIQG